MRTRDLQAAAATLLILLGMQTPLAVAQAAEQQNATPAPTVVTPAPDTTPSAPAPAATSTATAQPGSGNAITIPDPVYTQPLFLRDTNKDYTHAKSPIPVPIRQYTATNYDLPRLTNTPRLDQLLRDGKIYLSLADAVTLALENNFDIAIARINLDIADTDLLRARAGSTLRGVSTGLVTGTLGGTTDTVTSGGGPGGTSTANGGAGAGTSGLVESTNGGGPLPESFDPYVTGNVQLERATFPGGTNSASATGTPYTFTNTNTNTYDVNYFEGFKTGTALTASYDNTRTAMSQFGTSYSPQLAATFNVQLTQHLLQGCCIWLNDRFVVQAKNDRRITDSAFRQQIIYTVTQVEDIYWGLVSAYEDAQAKQRAIEQSQKLLSDNRKQLQIGTLAPLDVVNSESSVASDQQALISSQTNLEYQQLIMKQAIARDLNDPALTAAPVVPTDRVSTERLPEEDLTVDALVQQAYANNPQIEQAALDIQNDQITVKAFKNGLLPTVDAYAFYGASAIGGKQGATAYCGASTSLCAPGALPTVGFGGEQSNLFNNSAPNKGIGINVTIPIRNRTAQADQARSQMEYRQAQMRLQQLYTQIRIEVINQQYALTNDRAQLTAAVSARDYNAQSLDAEKKKYSLGASTTANVLQQSRNLATAEDTLFSAEAAYAKDRASLRQLLASTLTAYNISINDAATGTVTQQPAIPGVAPAKPPAPVQPIQAQP